MIEPLAPSLNSQQAQRRRHRPEALRLAHRLLDERCRYQARQTLFEPLVIAALVAVLGTRVNDPVFGATLSLWAGLLTLVSVARLVVATAILRKRFCRDARPHALLFRVSTGLTGLLLGAATSLFFPHIDLQGRMLITLALAGWLAAAMALHAAFPRHARFHLVLVVGQLALAWWLVDPVQGTYWAAGLIAGAALLERLSHRLSITLAVAQRGRHERRDLLRRLAVESRQARAASTAASRFLAAASHDLRQPATALSLMSSLLSERCTEPSLKPLTDGIARSSVALNDLLGNLLDLSRLEAGVVQANLDRHPLDEIIDDLRLEFEERAQAKGLVLHAESCGGFIHTDRVLLMRTLRNLLENALRYTDQGSITLSARRETRLEFAVTDTGIGIPEALHRRLLSDSDRLDGAATRSRRNGLGIGLAMVKRIAMLLDAELAIESDGQTGSRFTLRLPSGDGHSGESSDSCWAAFPGASPGASPVPDPGPEALPGDRRACHIHEFSSARALLVDDATEVAGAVAAMLESRGYRVDCAANAADALGLLSGASRFQLIVSDFWLGGPIDGVELLQRARLLQPQARCILATADTRTLPSVRARQAGFEFLQKPFHPDSFG